MTEDYIRHDMSSDTVVLFNIANNGYAFWVGSLIKELPYQICFWPFVVETGYSVEYITTEEEFNNKYKIVGIL